MSAVAGKLDPGKYGVLFVQLRNQSPRLVFGAVVHKANAAARIGHAPLRQFLQLFPEPLRRDGKHLLLIVAGNHQIKKRRHLVLLSTFSKHTVRQSRRLPR